MRSPAILLAAIASLTAFAVPARSDEIATVTAGRILFEHRCRVCHADDPGLRSYGPPLVGVIGRQAGTFPGYVYSDAMKEAGIVWTPDAVKAWMASNTEMMPGTKMRHVGVTDPAEQDFIVAFLQSLTP